MTKKIRDGVDRTLFELECGIFSFGLLSELILAVLRFILKDRMTGQWGFWFLSAGLWAGILLAAAYAFHMWWSLDRALSFDRETAVKKLRLAYLIRYLVLVTVLALAGFSGLVSWVTMFIGFMGVKIGAYLNRPMKLISDRIYGKEPPCIPPEEQAVQDTGGI